ncbi:MAG: hypothetical protein JXR68_13015 [Bacteroidales bacterium]|nr:hypothetical protein [Bacteroidales bacterium]
MFFLYPVLLDILPTEASKLTEYGLLGTLLLLAVSIIAYMFRDFMREKRQIHNERNVKENQQNELEKEFRNYLIETNSKLINVIEKNTDALNNFSRILSNFQNIKK